jgi:hypothetical protein
MVDVTIDEGTLHAKVHGFGEVLATMHMGETVPLTDVTAITLGASKVEEFNAHFHENKHVDNPLLSGIILEDGKAHDILGGFHDLAGDLNFYDVHADRVDHVVSIALQNHKYANLVIDVEDPQATIALVSSAVATEAAAAF